MPSPDDQQGVRGSSPGRGVGAGPHTTQRLIAGRYRLRAVLGHGSMGTVWSAYDEFLRRPVAVKEVKLPPGVPPGQAEELRERAMREARAIASLSHPNVITLHDVVREEGAPFVVMELLTARSLAGLLAEHGPLSVGQAATVGDALAAALEAAHAAGITHRDVKPGNVLIAADGRVKLTDFGIARNVSEVTMTSAGLMLGSPAYMAPEVASGKKVSPAADLWGLGATLYAVTEGEPPYDADGDPVATAHQVVHGDVPEPGPGPLADVIRALMSKDPDARPAPADVRASLHDLRNPPGPLFDAELFEHSAHPAADQPAKSKPAAATDADAAGSSSGTAPLAADPGPLPFATGPTSSAEASGDAAPAGGRSATKTALVLVLATVLFLAAAAGGFAAARTLGGVPVLPALAGNGTGGAGGEPPADGAQEDEPLVTRSGEATIFSEEEGAQFSVEVPASWTRFASLQAAGPLPASTLIEFVSADGRQVLSVQRFGAFFPAHNIADYLRMLQTSWPGDQYDLVDAKKPRVGDDIMYRTVESGRGPAAGDTQGRTTFARLQRDGPHLWVVSVTVPTEQEGGGRTRLFDKLLPTFTIS